MERPAILRRHHGVGLGVWWLPLLLLLGAAPALADAVPPDQYACGGKQAGDACTLDGKAGRCQTTDGCIEKDMAHWDRDASTYPPVVTYACPTCVPSADGGCAIATPSAADRILPWLLAASFSLLFLFGRRRRRR